MSTPLTSSQEAGLKALTEVVATQLLRGRSPFEIIDDLTRAGLDRSLAEQFVATVAGALAEIARRLQERKKARTLMFVGIGVAIVGVIITAMTSSFVNPTGAGYLWWVIMAAGALVFAFALVKWFRNRM